LEKSLADERLLSAVTNGEDDYLVAPDGVEDAVNSLTATIQEMPDFLRKVSIFWGEGTSLR
jgi:hypothetical protein